MEGENNKLLEKEGNRVQSSLTCFRAHTEKSDEGLGQFYLPEYCLPETMLGHVSAKLKLIQACKILYAKLGSSVTEY